MAKGKSKFENSSTSKMMRDAIVKDEATAVDGRKRLIPIDLIDPNPDNETIYSMEKIDELADRINDVGFIESKAIGVYAKKDGRYEIYNGERRWRASKLAGLKEIPAIVSLMPDEATKAITIVQSNNNGREKSVIERAREIAYIKRKVLDSTDTWRDKDGGKDKRKKLQEIFGISGPSIHRYEKLIELIDELQDLIHQQLVPYKKLVDLKTAHNFTDEMQHELADMCTNYLKDNEDESTISETRMEQFIYRVKQKFERQERRNEEIEKFFAPKENVTNNADGTDAPILDTSGQQTGSSDRESKTEIEYQSLQREPDRNHIRLEGEGKVEAVFETKDKENAVIFEPAQENGAVVEDKTDTKVTAINFEEKNEFPEFKVTRDESDPHTEVNKANAHEEEERTPDGSTSILKENAAERYIDEELNHVLDVLFELTEDDFDIKEKDVLRQKITVLNKVTNKLKLKSLE